MAADTEAVEEQLRKLQKQIEDCTTSPIHWLKSEQMRRNNSSVVDFMNTTLTKERLWQQIETHVLRTLGFA